MARQPRVRTKTFTGCWTCRSRKLKCDEEKPHCKQCMSKHLDCAGYGTRLRWLTPDSTGKSRLPSTADICGFQRGNVCSNASIVELGEIEINNALCQIEVDIPPLLGTICRGPFSVFSVRTREETPPRPELQSPASATEPYPNPDMQECAFDNPVNETPLDDCGFPTWNAKLPESVTNYSEPSAALSLQESIFSPTTSDDSASHFHHSLYNTSNDSSADIIRSGSPALIDSNIFNRSFERSFMTPEVRFLLSHYMNHVIDIMTVVSTMKSPWKSVHLPRTLQGCGELEAVGTTCNARNALINALLSISAFNLAQKLGGHHISAEAVKWSKVAQKYRLRALNFLKICLQADFKPPSKVRYKEILAAMLSMITIDVISGDTKTCKMHIAGCRSLIEMFKQNPKRTYSTKARALHRVFLYLWVIQESTALGFDHMKLTADDCGAEQNSPEDTTNWLAAQQEATPELEDSTSELVYGVPQGLFALLGQTTSLVRQIRSYLTSNPNKLLSQALIEKCRVLENEILEWPVDTILFHKTIAPLDGDTRQIIYHQAHSFHQSIIIFFSQHVRFIHRQYLQPYVRNVIDHLEAIENIKTRIGITAGPIVWPGFVAASEAVDTPLQDRFQRWFDNLEIDYGLGNVSAAKAVINEVWERRRGSEEGVRSDWRMVAESQNAYLMLT